MNQPGSVFFFPKELPLTPWIIWSCGEGAMISLHLPLMNLTLTSWKSIMTADTPLAACRKRTFPELRAWKRCWTGCCHTGTALWSQRYRKARPCSFLLMETAAGHCWNTWKVCYWTEPSWLKHGSNTELLFVLGECFQLKSAAAPALFRLLL